MIKKYTIELGSEWTESYSGRHTTVRKIHVEDGETFIWYGYYGEDRTYECGPEEFARRFVQKETA